jgi:16S rRNA (guanine527-N7)-methyltransferase
MSKPVRAAMPPGSKTTAFGPEQFATESCVSRETLARMKTYAEMLEDWNARHNLVSRASLADVWRRHFWDSAQLAPLIPQGVRSLIDLGSGAGFPGLILAELLKDRPQFRVVLVEATAKKCQFLQCVAERLALPVQIRNARVEELLPEIFDVITARACAPLPELLAYAQRFWSKGTRGFFHKGQNLAVELTQAGKSWRIKAEQHPSRSDPAGVILEIRELQRVAERRPDRS